MREDAGMGDLLDQRLGHGSSQNSCVSAARLPPTLR
jgi:hypothetical protein